MNDVTQILKDAKSLIANENDWFQGSLINSSGCMCALGAIALASGLYEDKEHCYSRILADGIDDDVDIYSVLDYNPAVIKLADAIENAGYAVKWRGDATASAKVFRFNDDASHAEVMAMFDKAIEN
jgi:hypothetical protein